MLKLNVIITTAVLSLCVASQANSAFMGRLETSPGSGIFQAYYDDQLDITWASNANINGLKSWDDHVAWVAELDIGGVTGWRLPSADVNGDNNIIDCIGAGSGGVAGCSDNEMGFLYWEEDITAFAPGLFTNIQSFSYWSSTVSDPNPCCAWVLELHTGGQDDIRSTVNGRAYAWAVHDGDVDVVPIPGAVWLFGTGLLGLLGFSRNKY